MPAKLVCRWTDRRGGERDYVFRRRGAEAQRPTKRGVAAGVAEDGVAHDVVDEVMYGVADGSVEVFDRSGIIV